MLSIGYKCSFIDRKVCYFTSSRLRLMTFFNTLAKLDIPIADNFCRGNGAGHPTVFKTAGLA